LGWLDAWAEKSDFYEYLEENNKLSDKDRMPESQDILFYLECYIDLSTERQSGGFGLPPIPFSKIISYQQYFGLSEDFTGIIRAIDLLYLKQVNDKSKKEK
jgi:hypothetical protein